MPFQVTYSKKPRIFRQITLKTAGDDQFHICTPTIFLEAEVEGDLLGHTITWEQTDGTTVNLLGGTTLTPQFNAVDSTDKVLRCVIDKGTPYEQFAEVTIFKTPISFFSMSLGANRSWISDPFALLPVDAATITSFVDVTVPPPTSLQGEELGAIIVVEVEWDHPGQARYDQYISQYKVIENGVTVDEVPDTPTLFDSASGTGPPTDARFYAGTFANYRIDTHYNINGIEYVRESDEVDFTTLPVPEINAYNDSHSGLAFEPNQDTWHTRTNYRNIVLSEESDFGMSFEPNQDTWHARTTYTNGVMTEESSFGMSMLVDEQWINITRYDPSGIGSG